MAPEVQFHTAGFLSANLYIFDDMIWDCRTQVQSVETSVVLLS